MCRVHYAVSDTTPHTHVAGSVLIGLSVVNSYRETPGPIPNPEAKLIRADGTALGRVWESRSLPNFNVVLWGVSLRLPTVFLCKLKTRMRRELIISHTSYFSFTRYISVL